MGTVRVVVYRTARSRCAAQEALLQRIAGVDVCGVLQSLSPNWSRTKPWKVPTQQRGLFHFHFYFYFAVSNISNTKPNKLIRRPVGLRSAWH